MNESASPQRRRPPGWRAARPASSDPAPGDMAADESGDSVSDTAGDTAFGRGETVERPAVRLPAEDSERDHLVIGDHADADRTGEEDEQDEQDEQDDASAEAHPVLVPLAGFFAGMAYIIGLPVLYVWLSNPDSIGDVVGVDLAWLLAAVLVPVFLTAIPQTRKFGRYMLFGVVLSAIVVLGVAAVVLAVLIFLT